MTDPAQTEPGEPDNSTPSADETAGPSPLFVHLEELRRRLIYCIAFLAAGCVVGFFLTEHYLFGWLLSPILAIPDARLQVLGPAEKFSVYFKISFAAGFVIAVPFIIHQIWLFLRPGLKPNERRFLILLIPSAIVLFTLGAGFIFFVMIPAALKFLLGFDLGVEIETAITLDRYFSFVLLLVLAGGLVFQIPLVTYFFARIGLLTSQTMVKHRRFAILGTAVLAAVLTPTGDPFNFLLLALPIYVLYEVSILIAAASYRGSG